MARFLAPRQGYIAHHFLIKIGENEMLSANVISNLNAQIAAEFDASQLYLQMAAYFEINNLKGFAKYMRSRADEERAHGLKFYTYLLDNMEAVLLLELPAPQASWNDYLEVFTEILEQEKKVTSLINNIYKIAALEGDYATMSFLNWFIDEQVQEINEATYNVEHIKFISNDIAAILEFDEKLGEEASKSFNITLQG